MNLKEDFKNKFKKFKDEDIETYLPIYETSYKAYYGGAYGKNIKDNEIILFLIAHLITVSKNTDDGQSLQMQVSSQSVDGVSVSYAVPQSTSDIDAFFRASVYGITYLALKKTNIGIHFVG